jgi:hypothetical protein
MQWEYRVHWLRTVDVWTGVALNRAGAEGWQVVAVIPEDHAAPLNTGGIPQPVGGYRVVFQRPVEDRAG